MSELPIQEQSNANQLPEVADIGGDSEARSAGADWAAIRVVYETQHEITTKVIFARFGITKNALQQKVEREGWTPRRPNKAKTVSRAKLLRRMLEALERQMRRIETDKTIPDERKTIMLGTMTRTLAKILDVERSRKSGKAKRTVAASAELTLLREKIARRIEQLNQG